MRLHLIRKEDLTPDQLGEFDKRLQASIRTEGECGPVRAWYEYTRYLYSFVSRETRTPIAIAESSGRPASGPGWWIDPEFRGQRYGNDLVDALAEHLRKDGVTSILPIQIQTIGGRYDMQSSRLEQRMRSHFS